MGWIIKIVYDTGNTFGRENDVVTFLKNEKQKYSDPAYEWNEEIGNFVLKNEKQLV